MAVIGTTKLTISDWAKRLDPEGKIAKIVEILNETNPVLDDMVFVEGNLATGHKTTIRSGLPSATWRKLNYGVQPTKSRTVQVTDTCGMLENYAEVDKSLADLNGNSGEFRLSEDHAFIEGMNQDMASILIYGNTATDPEKFMGLAPRYNLTTAENGGNIVTGDGTGSDNTSIWLIVWGQNTCHGIFPKGQKTGLVHQDLGEQTLEDVAGGKYQGYRSHYKWDIGFCLRNWRYVVRIANLDVSNFTKDAATGSDLIELMVRAMHKIPSKGMGSMVFYCNEDVMTYLDLQTLNKSNNALTYGPDIHGQEVLKFRGVPVKQCDAILSTEAVVS